MIDNTTRTRLLEVLRIAEPQSNELARALGNEPAPLFDGAVQLIREAFGRDLETEYSVYDLEDVTSKAPDDALMAFLVAAWTHLTRLSSFGETASRLRLSPSRFEARVNEILEAGGHHQRLAAGRLKDAVDSEAAALRRVLLRDPSDAAGCQQGDVQVEIVASTIQKQLDQAGSVLVDYGAGLGRVLAGLSSAQLFKQAHYIGVDEPVSKELKALGRNIGASTAFFGRDQYLASGPGADVIMVVNTLHHIPFSDIPRQLDGLLRKVKPGGYLLIHEMNELREPEQRNVPWRVEDVVRLFESPALKTNLRTTVTKGKKVPLCNLLVQVTGTENVQDALRANTAEVWRQMKERTLAEIEMLYGSKDDGREIALQYALIVNANLDLNKP